MKPGNTFKQCSIISFFRCSIFFPMKRKFQAVSFSMSTSIKEKFPILDLLILNKVFHVT